MLGGCEEGNPKLCSWPPRPLRAPALHQLIARARRLVVFYCVLRGPVHRDGPDQAAAADLEEIYEVPDAAVAEERRKHTSERDIKGTLHRLLYTQKVPSVKQTHVSSSCAHLKGLSMDVAVTLKCLYLRAFILSLVVIPSAAICAGPTDHGLGQSGTNGHGGLSFQRVYTPGTAGT